MMGLVLTVLTGVLVGGVCVFGLGYGFKLVQSGMLDETLEEKTKKRKVIIGSLMIGGQLLLAGLIIFITPWWRQNPIALVCGMLPAIFLFSFLMGKNTEK